MAVALTAYSCPFTAVPSLKYLGRVMLESYNDWPEVTQNLQRVRQKWVHLLQVLGQERVDARTSGMFYSVVVLVVLLYGSY